MRVLDEDELQTLRELAERLEDRGLTEEGATIRLLLQNDRRYQGVRAAAAAAIVQMPVETIRGWVRRGILAGRIDEAGEVFVDLEALQPVLELDAAMPYADPGAPDISDEEILAEIAAVRSTRDDA